MAEHVDHQIEGEWHSQLGSRVVFHSGEGGRLTGMFCSSVSAGGEHPLTGFYEPSSDGETGAIGFAVRWRQTHSVTVWAGHYDQESQTIVATWLLSGPPFGREEWHSMTVGHDTFHPSSEQRVLDGHGASRIERGP